ncbi:RNA-directed DNA polymerase, eukaryota [Tanacetum coccineum]|uniref:RNA-directed DNA polymerase, eukaryota n=1 Tax=Tanacetum coccineum TaxID=301880 RepID=A0ABQ5CK55_9ASTR
MKAQHSNCSMVLTRWLKIRGRILFVWNRIDFNNATSLDMAQKDKIQWAIEGDENSKFFHGIINKKCSQLAIHEVLVDGDWIVDPSMVKNKFLKHFANRFAAPVTNMVWDCRINKSPGPDGFTFEFYRKYWNLIDYDVVAAVTSFFSTGSFPPGCNSSFIALIPKTQEAKMVKDFRHISLIGSMYKIITKILANPLSLIISELLSDVQSAFVSNQQILDGPFILNELLSWCKHKNTKALIFKIDFEKAFDSGDPLSPFLFILIMGSLHLFFNNVMKAGLYNGIYIDDSLSLSHLFYVDDVIFVGKWNLSNLSIIVNVLNLFYLATSLKINLYKSKLMGIGIPHDVVASAARSIGCSTLHTPFNYLRVKEFFQWRGKCKEEDVFDLLEENLASKKNGGLGVFRFFALNRALLFKWIWRFIANGSSLWSRFITAIYGARGALDDPPSYSRQSPWLDIVSQVRKLSNKGIDLLFLVKKKVGNGEATSFGNDVSPHSGIEEEQLLFLISNTSSAMLPNISDRWTWRLDSLGVFSVKSVSEFIDDYFLSKVDVPTR